MSRDAEAKEHQCLLIFYSDKSGNKVYIEAEKEIEITGFENINRILNLGFTTFDFESLFQSKEGVGYLTADSVYFRELSQASKERDIKSFDLVKEFMNENNLEILDNYMCFDFSFPSTLIRSLAKIDPSLPPTAIPIPLIPTPNIILDELEVFERQSVFFEKLRQDHDYWGGNILREMIDFCHRNQLTNIWNELRKLKSPF